MRNELFLASQCVAKQIAATDHIEISSSEYHRGGILELQIEYNVVVKYIEATE